MTRSRPTRSLLRSLAEGAGKILLRRWQRLGAGDIDFKGRRDMVTRADLESEAWLVAQIRRRFSRDTIVTEEVSQEATGSRRCWYLDPLDGTTNFVHGHPFFAVSIGVAEEGVLRWAAVHAPRLEETFLAERGRGATCNGRRIQVSRTSRLIRSLLATGFAYRRHEIEDNNLDHFASLLLRIQGIRRCGVASLDLAYVAAGTLDGFWELHLEPWDVAAGALLVEEAGGRVSGLRPGEDWLRGGRILATNGLLHDSIGRILRRDDRRRGRSLRPGPRPGPRA